LREGIRNVTGCSKICPIVCVAMEMGELFSTPKYPKFPCDVEIVYNDVLHSKTGHHV